MPSWFQLGTRKLARGIFSPGFWSSQRSLILGGAGHSGAQPANSGLMGRRAGRPQGRGVGSRRRRGRCDPAHLCSREESGNASQGTDCHAQDGFVGLRASAGGVGGLGGEGRPGVDQARPRPSVSMAWSSSGGLCPHLGMWGSGGGGRGQSTRNRKGGWPFCALERD